MRRVLAAVLVCGALYGCAPALGERKPGAAGARQPGAIRFEDVRPQSGIDFAIDYAAGTEPGIVETLGCPAALLDADGDGRLDVLLGERDRVCLYLNRGGWKFERAPDPGFRQRGRWQGVAVADVDGDGRPDVFLCGYGCRGLYLNQGGGRFREATAGSGLDDGIAGTWETGAAFADVDRNGLPDLYITRYVELGDRSGLCEYPHGVRTACSPTEFAPQRGRLYRNRGRGRFEDATAALGLSAAHGNGLGVVFGDPNGDGFPDLYLANDQRPCDLFLNQQGRRFTDVGTASGTAFGPDGSPQAGMGAAFGDFDDDGRADLVVTTYQKEPTSLYRNDGDGLFTNAAYASHLGAATADRVGWGVQWADLDNDGRLDLAIANGHPLHRIHEIDPTTTPRQPFQVFRNAGQGILEELPTVGEGLPRAIAGRALCSGDLDDDGRVDLLISDIQGQPLLLRNVSPAGAHWLTVRLTPAVEGARVTVRAGDRRWVRWAGTGGSYLSASDPRVHFGLGEAPAIESVEVRWPSGETTLIRNPAIDRELEVRRSAASEGRR